jgi:hypothetical protein
MKKSKSADALSRTEEPISLGHRRTPSIGVGYKNVVANINLQSPSRVPILTHPLPGREDLSMSSPLNFTPPGSPLKDSEISPRNRKGSSRGRGRGRGRGRASTENLLALEIAASPIVRSRSASSSGPIGRFEDPEVF